MQQAQMEQFSKRIQRIERGGVNTCQTVYTGVQETTSTRVSGVAHSRAQDETRVSSRRLMAQGLRSALITLAFLGAGILLFLKFAAG